MNRLLLIIFVLTSSVGCDQSSKYLASEWLANSSMITFLNDSLRLTYAENHGGFLSLGGSLPEQYRFWIFVVIVSMVLISMFCYLLINRQLSPLHFYGVCLVLGGGLSNLIDRVTNQGAVVDFLNMGIGSLRTGIFNMADVFILLGVVLFITARIKSRNMAQQSVRT